jgi:hypothetical protein
MRKIISLAVLLAVVALLLVTAVPAMANGVEEYSVVAPTIGGPNNSSVKAPVAQVPDKSTHPVHGSNPAFGGDYGDPGAPGKVFWAP